MNLKAVLEGILFIVGDEGTTIEEMASILSVNNDDVKQLLMELKKDYESEDRGLRISYLGNAFKLTTKEYYEKLVSDNKSNTLTNAALEVLAVIAYNEPVTRLKVDEIRGVNSTQIIRRLLARGFIKVCGKDNSIGKPSLYKTTDDFLDYFGLSTKDDLPKIEDITIDSDDEKDLFKSNYREIVRE